MAFGCRNSDARHGSDDMILLDGAAHRSLELVHVLASSLLHDLTHPRLADLEGFQRIRF